MGKVIHIVEKKLGRQNNWGESDQETGTVYIDPRALGRKHLEILIHESEHLLQPYLDEDAVKDIAAELTRVLWEQGYRRYQKFGNDVSQLLQDE